MVILDVGNLKFFYIWGNLFYDGFNIVIGVFGINELIVVDNVIYYIVGLFVRVWGSNNKVFYNLVVLSVLLGIIVMWLYCLNFYFLRLFMKWLYWGFWVDCELCNNFVDFNLWLYVLKVFFWE